MKEIMLKLLRKINFFLSIGLLIVYVLRESVCCVNPNAIRFSLLYFWSTLLTHDRRMMFALILPESARIHLFCCQLWANSRPGSNVDTLSKRRPILNSKPEVEILEMPLRKTWIHSSVSQLWSEYLKKKVGMAVVANPVNRTYY